MTQSIAIQTGSSNIFEDLGLENPGELLVKAEFVRKISGMVSSQKMTQAEAAELLGVKQLEVSALINSTTILPKRSLEEIMDSIGKYTQFQGLTPEILESILNNEHA